jgi:hypothetical protein
MATKTWCNPQIHKRRHLKKIVPTCSFVYLHIRLFSKKIMLQSKVQRVFPHKRKIDRKEKREECVLFARTQKQNQGLQVCAHTEKGLQGAEQETTAQQEAEVLAGDAMA